MNTRETKYQLKNNILSVPGRQSKKTGGTEQFPQGNANKVEMEKHFTPKPGA